MCGVKIFRICFHQIMPFMMFTKAFQLFCSFLDFFSHHFCLSQNNLIIVSFPLYYRTFSPQMEIAFWYCASIKRIRVKEWLQSTDEKEKDKWKWNGKSVVKVLQLAPKFVFGIDQLYAFLYFISPSSSLFVLFRHLPLYFFNLLLMFSASPFSISFFYYFSHRFQSVKSHGSRCLQRK